MPIDGEAVRILRERSGIKRSEFAARIGKSESYLRDIETGRRQLKRNRDLVLIIALELDVPARMVFSRPGATQCDAATRR